MKILVAVILALTMTCGITIRSTDHWPLGSYTVPKPNSGCPDTAKNTWKEAWRYQDLENDAKQGLGSKFSSNFHMDAKIFNNDIIRGFCTSLNANVQEPWPKGSYCIYRNSNYCPPNMKDGFIDWYDEQTNNTNKLRSYYHLPDGLYNAPSTRIIYCCQNEGAWYKSIELPTEKPFYLLPYGSRDCQRVMWAVSSLEYIVYDTEDDDNLDEFDGYHVFTDKVKSLPKVFYCYYEGCQYKLRNHSGSFSSPNFNNNSYPDFQYCSWSINVSAESLRILLIFPTLNVPNCEENSLDIYDRGSANESTLLARFCGRNATSGVKVTSRTNNMHIVLKSGNNSDINLGETVWKNGLRFHAQYKAFDTATKLISPIPLFTPTRKVIAAPHLIKVWAENTHLKTTTSSTKNKIYATTRKSDPMTSDTLTETPVYFSSSVSTTTREKTPTPLTDSLIKNYFSNPITALGDSRTISTTRKEILAATMTEMIPRNNPYDSERKDFKETSVNKSAIFLLTALSTLAIISLLIAIGVIVFWRRHRKKQAIITKVHQSEEILTAERHRKKQAIIPKVHQSEEILTAERAQLLSYVIFKTDVCLVCSKKAPAVGDG